MTESSSIILKILTALTSPKASIKFISVAIFITITWNNLSAFTDSSPHQDLISLFIGIGLGSLIGELFYKFLVYIYSLTIGKYCTLQEIKQKRIEEQKQKQKILEHFMITYYNLDKSTKRILWKLTEKEQCFYTGYGVNGNINALENNGYIKYFSTIGDDNNIYKIQPMIKHFLQEIYPNEIDIAFDNFIKDNNVIKEKMIQLMKENIQIEQISISLDELIEFCETHNELLEFFPKYNGFDNEIIGYTISFDPYHKERISNILGLGMKKIFFPKNK